MLIDIAPLVSMENGIFSYLDAKIWEQKHRIAMIARG